MPTPEITGCNDCYPPNLCLSPSYSTTHCHLASTFIIMAVPYQATSLEQRRSLRSPPESLEIMPDLIMTCPEDSQRRMVRWLVETYQLTILGASQGQLYLQLSTTITEAEANHPLLAAYLDTWQQVLFPPTSPPSDADKARVQRIALLIRRLCDDSAIVVIGSLIRLYPVIQRTTGGQFAQLVRSALPDIPATRLRLSANPRGLERQAGDLLVEEIALTPSLEACTHFVTLVQLTAEQLGRSTSARNKSAANVVATPGEDEHCWFVAVVAKAFFNDYFAWKERLNSRMYNMDVRVCAVLMHACMQHGVSWEPVGLPAVNNARTSQSICLPLVLESQPPCRPGSMHVPPLSINLSSTCLPHARNPSAGRLSPGPFTR